MTPFSLGFSDHFARQKVAILGDLVHLQDRFRVMGYRKIHENSDLCTFVLR
jgi:hypothetical protein